MGFGRGAGGVALDELPRGVAVAAAGERGEVEQEAVGQRKRRLGHYAVVDMVDRVAELLLDGLRG